MKTKIPRDKVGARLYVGNTVKCSHLTYEIQELVFGPTGWLVGGKYGSLASELVEKIDKPCCP
jgi:hypothetical protein